MDTASAIDDLASDFENKCWDLRKSQFKSNEKTSESLRDKRRIQLVQDLKQKRDILFNEKRGLFDHDFDENEDWMDWDNSSRGKRSKYVNALCENQIMLSEWLLDRPAEIESKWVCVVCPTGQRTLVIAKRGCTRAYHKNGTLLAKFKSILPNGGFDNSLSSGIVILDCIWQKSTKQLFALDVLYWNSQPFITCDAEFRLYWLDGKIRELQLNARNSANKTEGICIVFLPPQCKLSGLPQALAEVPPDQVDGVLFYHNNAPYVSGHTPLVGWLKPYMIPERLGIEVPGAYLSLRPAEYENLEQWVDKVSHSHRRKPRRGNSKSDEKMDIPDVDSSNASFISEMEDPKINMLNDLVNEVVMDVTTNVNAP